MKTPKLDYVTIAPFQGRDDGFFGVKIEGSEGGKWGAEFGPYPTWTAAFCANEHLFRRCYYGDEFIGPIPMRGAR